MKFTFEEDREPLWIRKIPKQNIIEAKTGGKKILYERTKEGLKKINDETHPREDLIIEVVQLHFMGYKQNRHRIK
jgi:hypothetical protein